MEDKTETNPGVLTSYGYPLYYPTGGASIWTVKFAKGQYISLLFSNISLNRYQVMEEMYLSLVFETQV